VRRGEVKISGDTFAQYWVRFLAAKRPYVTRGTLFDYAMHGEKRLLPAFGERKLSSIERADIRAWLAEMADVVEVGRLSAKTANNALTRVSVCFNQAIDDRLIATNPCQRIKRLPEAPVEMDSCACTRSRRISPPAPITTATSRRSDRHRLPGVRGDRRSLAGRRPGRRPHRQSGDEVTAQPLTLIAVQRREEPQHRRSLNADAGDHMRPSWLHRRRACADMPSCAPALRFMTPWSTVGAAPGERSPVKTASACRVE
jgi:hypothetical protein